jgi:hypothetical protein
MTPSLRVRRRLRMLAMALALTFQAASPCAASPSRTGLSHDRSGCLAIPKYPHGIAWHYAERATLGPPSYRPEDILDQATPDKLQDIVDWYKKALPGWRFVPANRWSPQFVFVKPQSNLSVVIRESRSQNAIVFNCGSNYSR